MSTPEDDDKAAQYAAKLAPTYRDAPEREPEFYYSRERRLAHASSRLRELNETGLVKKGGIFRALTSTKGNTMILMVIALMSVLITIASRTIYKDGGGVRLGENILTASARRVSETTYIELKKKALGDTSYTGPVDLAVSIPQKKGKSDGTGEVPPIETFRFFFTLKEDEEFRFALSFDAPEFLMVMRAGETFKTIRVKAK
ncbi:hypothetical protein AGMMS50267_02910 [Spirochaetia bacterium]|nr:hypothetical protein AGMMS50267_02910 [Spirochaetia bacterium]